MNRCKRFAPQAAAGLSLVELMISIALVAIILAGVVKIYADSHRSFLSNEGVARTQEGIRYALDHISRNASRAGYMGCADFFTDPNADGIGQNLEVLLASEAGVGGRFDFTNPVSGTDSGDPAVPDTLVLRAAQSSTGIALTGRMVNEADAIRVDATQLTNSSIAAGDVLVVSDCNRSTVFMATAVSGGQIAHDGGTVVSGQNNTNANFSYMFGREGRSLATVYSASETTIAYTIVNNALRANGDELLQGVENLQVKYGVQDPGGIQYQDASAGLNWRGVVSIQLTLTINSADRAFTTENDGLVRKEVSHIIALRNNNL